MKKVTFNIYNYKIDFNNKLLLLTIMMSKLYETNITIDGESDIFFIHFKTSDECDNFKTSMMNSIFGDKCCSGKGVHLKSHDGIKITSYNQIHKISLDQKAL